MPLVCRSWQSWLCGDDFRRGQIENSRTRLDRRVCRCISSELSYYGVPAVPLSPPSSAKRIVSLDVLRGIAIGLVLFAHVPFDRPTAWFGYPTLKRLILSGWIGVDLFFVLSGFLVAGLLFREFQRRGTIDVGRFLLRRGLKIWPSYYAAFGAMLALEILLGWFASGTADWGLIPRTWPSWLFLQNYAYNNWTWTWTLAVEEHFYLTIPFCLLLLLQFRERGDAQRRSRLILGSMLAFCACILAARTAQAFRFPASAWKTLYYPTHFRVDSLLFGVLISYVYHFHRSWFERLRPYRILILLSALVLLAPVTLWPLGTGRFCVSIGFTLLYLSFGGILIVTMLTDWSRCPHHLARAAQPMVRVLQLLGIYSYTIYITHFALYRLVPDMNDALRGWLTTHWGLSTWPATLIICTVYVVIAIGSGMLLSHVVERPVLAWRERRFRGHHVVEATAATAAGPNDAPPIHTAPVSVPRLDWPTAPV